MNRILVTGGAGFIGANYVQRRLREGLSERVVVLDSLTYAGNRSSLASLDSDERFQFVHGDIRDNELVEKILRDQSLDTIFEEMLPFTHALKQPAGRNIVWLDI